MSDTVTVTIGDPTGRPVSPDLWGLFLEDINYSLDGGLNADLVRNGDFEATPADAPGWGPTTGWEVEGTGRLLVRSAEPLSPRNATHARLDAGAGAIRLRNLGYDPEGAFLRAGTHRLRFAARAVQGDAVLDVELVGVAPASPSRARVEVVGARWAWYEADLEVDDTGVRALELGLAAGVVDLDMIELRPLEQRAGSPAVPALFREDLVQALADLRPSFVRFPGGCVAHGYGLDNIYHWKDTIGAPQDRRSMPNVWGYRQSMRIGYHEYFLLCERLGASPMPVVAAGVCCQNVPGGPQAIPQQRMPQYVQDVLDLVEYANGPADSRWGAVRAAAGHPEPFGLRYLGLGNEDVVDAQFENRFTQIFDVVQSAHPEITVIGTLGPKPYGPDYDNGWDVARRHGVGMVDEHSYRTPRWLLQNVDRFDGYDRQGPAVYLGEWAARSSTVRSAVAEAAYMVGVERNSDIVRLASYAPLLARVGSTQWVPDLVYFTAAEVRPSASYHVARMLAAHRGDEVLACRTDGDHARPQPLPCARTLELRSPGATVRFTAVTVDGEPRHDVVTDADGTTVVVTGRAGEAGAPVEIELTAERTDGEEGFVVAFGDAAAGTVHELRVGEWRNRGLTLSRRDDAITDEVEGPHRFDGVRSHEPVRVRVRLDGARVRTWLDGRAVHDHADDVRDVPGLVAGATRRGPDTLLTLVSAADEPRRVRVEGGAARPGTTVHLTTLAGADPGAGAPFETSPVVPHASTTVVPDDGLELEIAPWSVTTAVVTGG